MHTTRHIPAELVKLALVARKARPQTRWAAIANHHWSTRRCHWRRDTASTLIAQPPLLSPMQRGRIVHVIQRQRSMHGLPSIRQTFGTGLRALLAEPPHVLHAEVRP